MAISTKSLETKCFDHPELRFSFQLCIKMPPLKRRRIVKETLDRTTELAARPTPIHLLLDSGDRGDRVG
jgi:hypothetical protein